MDLLQQPAGRSFGGISIFWGCLASPDLPKACHEGWGLPVNFLSISPDDLAGVGLRPEVQHPGKWQRRKVGGDEREVDAFKALKSQDFFV